MPQVEVCNCASCFLIRQNEYEQREFIHIQKGKLKTFLLTYSYSYWLAISLFFILADIYFYFPIRIILSLFGEYIVTALLIIIPLNYAFAISYLSYILEFSDALSHIFTISLIYSFLITVCFVGFNLYLFFAFMIGLFLFHFVCFFIGNSIRVAKNKRLNPIN
ncbi:MAG: hypothetical protein WAQ98_26410 [Blastocatellia bacterium]